MLESMRRSSRSLLIYLMFGIVILVFIISFGPQSVGGFASPGGGPAQSVAAEVEGRPVTMNDYRYAFLNTRAAELPMQIAKAQRVREQIMDAVIQRELFAAEAERLGLKVSDAEAEDFVAQAKMMMFGSEQTIPWMQKDGHFEYEAFRRFVASRGLTPKAFIEQQKREMLAARARDLIVQGVTVSESEVKERFIREGNQINLEYVRFPVRRYEEEVQPSDAEVAAFAAANEAKLKSLYDERSYLYKGAPKELKLRAIQVKLDAGASADAEAAAQKKAEGLAARAQKEDFATVAKTASDDARTKARGGLVGWKRQGATTFGVAVEEKVWAGKQGDVVGPVKGSDGFYVVKIEGAREGDIAFDAVKLELAEGELKQEQAKAKAKADAEAALVKAKAAQGTAWKTLFPGSTAEAEKVDDKKAKAVKAPAPSDPTPEAQETGLFSRRGAVVEGIGLSPELAKQVFTLTTEAPFAGPVEVAGSFVVVKLKEKKDADLADWEKRKAEMIDGAAQWKGRLVAEQWAMQRCSEAKQGNKVKVNPEALRYDDGQDVAYEACAPKPSFGF